MAQTPDTDLNQHIRREYTDEEATVLISQMRAGVKVPKLTPEESVDIMYKVLSQSRLHLNAAEGYKKTCISVALDGTEDHHIVREALEAWNDRGMRAKIDEITRKGEREFRAGRLTWCKRDVQRLIRPYPAKPEVDRILQGQQVQPQLRLKTLQWQVQPQLRLKTMRSLEPRVLKPCFGL